MVKTKAKKFFEARFVGESEPLIRSDNVRFTSLSNEDNVSLIGAVSVEEIKNIVWSCDSSKSPGPSSSLPKI